jgi:ectoine hydroxylase-related dioxygenase (phytanoyl-CoA dioxygenase family)
MLRLDCKTDQDWLARARNQLQAAGCCLVENVLDAEFVAATRQAMYQAREAIWADMGQERLQRAGELGVLRLAMKYDPHFLKFLEIPEVLAIVDEVVGNTAILHLQNGLLLPALPPGETPSVFQNRFHRDFPRYLNGYVASVNMLFAIDEFSEANGGTIVAAGTQQRETTPELDELRARAEPVICPPGAMIVFDSTLWHAAGVNESGRDRLGINHQFTRSWIKQQIDYVRALGTERVLALPERSQQLLGWYTRVVTSLDEFYQPEATRLYRRGQG